MVIDSASVGPVGQPAGPVVDEGVELVVGHHPVDQPELGRLLGASRMSAKKASSLARWSPMSRGSSHDAPKSTDRPRLEKICENRADVGRHHQVAAERHAHAGAGGHAPDLGDGGLGQAVQPEGHVAEGPHLHQVRVARAGRPRWTASPRSAPEQKASPAPVSTMHPVVDGRRRRRRRSSSSSRHMVPLAAFLRSGRFMVTVTTPSVRSTIRVSSSLAMPAAYEIRSEPPGHGHGRRPVRRRPR